MITLLVALLAILLAGGALAAYLLTQKTAKQRFFEAQLLYAQGMVEEITRESAVPVELQKRVSSDPSQITYTLSGNVGGGLADQLGGLNQFLRRSSLEIVTLNDPHKSISGLTGSLKVSGSELASLEFWRSEENLALRMPILHRNYMALENRDLKKAFDKLGIPYTGPDRIAFKNSVTGISSQNRTALGSLAGEYGRFLYEAIHDDEVIRERQSSFDSPDGPVKLDKLVLTLSEERLRQILTDTATRFAGDEKALDLLSEIVAGLAKETAEFSAYDPQAQAQFKQWQDRAYVRSELKAGAGRFGNALRDVKFPGGVTWTIYVDGKRLVDQSLTFAVDAGNGDGAAFTIGATDWLGKDEAVVRNGKIMVAPLERRNAGEALQLEWKTRTTTSSKAETRSVANYRFEYRSGNETLQQYQLELNTIRQKEAELGKDRTTYEFGLSIVESGNPGPKISGKVISLGSNAIRKDQYEQNYDVSVSVVPKSKSDPGFNLDLKLGVAVDLSAKSIQFPDLNTANSVRLNDISSRDLAMLMSEIQRSVARFAARNANLFQ